MAGDLSASQCGDIFLPTSRQASSNYGIGSDGQIMCYVDEDSRAWTSSSPWNDHQAITVEVANLDNETGRISDQAWQSLIKLATDVCHRYNFRLSFDNTPNGSLTMHKMYSSTDCPGPWIESHMGEIASTVNKNLDTGNYEYSGVANGLAMGNGSMVVVSDPAIAYALGINAKILFDQEEIYPFMITIDKNSPDLDFDKLKEFDVIGVCIDMGSYFDDIRMVAKVFRSPKLDAQVKACQEAKMPFALFTEVKAKTVDEAVKELYEIKLAVRKYPPQMGLWLKLNLQNKSKTINNDIVKMYYDTLYKWGFFDQLGFYNSKSELEKIDWTDIYCEDWYWWMDRHLKSVDRIHYLPTPKFFMYDDPGDEDALIEPDFQGAARLLAGMGGSSASSSLSGGYTDYQKAVSDAGESGQGCTTAAGWCGQFVTDVFTQARKVKGDIQVPFGNAIDYWTKWKSSGSTDKNAPVGSVVVGSGWAYNSDGSNPYGHVGVVLTDGRVADNVGRHRISSSVDDWVSGQNAPCNGYRGYIGWVWANGQDLSKLGSMIGGGKAIDIPLSEGGVELGTYGSYELDPAHWNLLYGPGQVQALWRSRGSQYNDRGASTIDGKLMIACTTTFGDCGDWITWVFTDGTTLETIVADTKNPGDAGCTKWGHDGGRNILEFMGDSRLNPSPYGPLGLAGKRLKQAINRGNLL